MWQPSRPRQCLHPVRRLPDRPLSRTMTTELLLMDSVLHPAERAPRQVMEHALLHQDHGEIGYAADHGQHEDRDEDHRGIRLALAEGQEVAESEIAADQLAHHHADHRERRGDAQAREQRRQRGWELDLPEDLRARRRERPREVDEVRIDGADRGSRCAPGARLVLNELLTITLQHCRNLHNCSSAIWRICFFEWVLALRALGLSASTAIDCIAIMSFSY